MLYRTFEELVNNSYHELTDEAFDILNEILRDFDEDDSIDIESVNDKINDYVDGYFTYYYEAFNYLESNNVTDWSDAIYNGCDNVCSVAFYYLTEELNNYISENFDDFELNEELEEFDEDLEGDDD